MRYTSALSHTQRALYTCLFVAVCSACVACSDDSSSPAQTSPTMTTPATTSTDVGGDIESDVGSDDTGGSDTGTGDTGDAPDATLEPLQADQYCEESAAFFCAYYMRCGRMAVRTQEECEAVFLETCNSVYEPRYTALAAEGKMELSREGLATCAEHLEAVECAQHIFDLDGPCRAIWAGQVEEGGACAPGLESFVCSEGTTCRLGLDFCGTCIPAAAIGEDCGGPEIGCVEDATCVDGTCVRRGLVGDACSENAPCVTAAACSEDGVCTSFTTVALRDACSRDARCPYKSDCIDGVCVEAALLGESCETRRCTSGLCVDDVCTALALPGEPCTRAAACTSGACTEGVCAALPGACFAEEGGE